MTDDLISRQAAIEAVHKVIFEFFDPCGDDEETPFTEKDKLLLKVNKAISNGIKSLPTAEPDMARAIATIIENEQDMRIIERNAEPRWTPVTERLPEHFGRYLVTFVPDAGELWTKVEFAMFSDLMGLKKEPIFWNGSVGKADFENVTKNVTAWMPLPEPWKGEE